MLDLFSPNQEPKTDLSKAEQSTEVNTPQGPMKATPTIGEGTRQRQYVKPSDALPIYNAVIDHLAKHDVPPFSTFYLRSVTPNVLKWCIESPMRPPGQSTTPPNQLVLFMLVTRPGQNSEKPETTYQEWERIYSRTLNPAKMPIGMNSKPRKTRKARGSRLVVSKEKDAS